jgi:hypothetical protein
MGTYHNLRADEEREKIMEEVGRSLRTSTFIFSLQLNLQTISSNTSLPSQASPSLQHLEDTMLPGWVRSAWARQPK